MRFGLSAGLAHCLIRFDRATIRCDPSDLSRSGSRRLVPFRFMAQLTRSCGDWRTDLAADRKWLAGSRAIQIQRPAPAAAGRQTVSRSSLRLWSRPKVGQWGRVGPGPVGTGLDRSGPVWTDWPGSAGPGK